MLEQIASYAPYTDTLAVYIWSRVNKALYYLCQERLAIEKYFHYTKTLEESKEVDIYKEGYLDTFLEFCTHIYKYKALFFTVTYTLDGYIRSTAPLHNRLYDIVNLISRNMEEASKTQEARLNWLNSVDGEHKIFSPYAYILRAAHVPWEQRKNIFFEAVIKQTQNSKDDIEIAIIYFAVCFPQLSIRQRKTRELLKKMLLYLPGVINFIRELDNTIKSQNIIYE